jgi:hypothetical protein
MSVASAGHVNDGVSKTERDAIGEQLDRLVASPYFSHSKRLPNFLRFVVEHTLSGEAESIKERIIGVEIFGREASYDTASDPIVRVTAAEIRKRMAQYYQDPAHEEELRITLPSGSYVPHFHPARTGEEPGLPEANALAAVPVELSAVPEKRFVPGWRTVFIVAVAIAAAGGAALMWQRSHRSGFDQFWEPMLATHEPVLLCIADQNEYSEIALRDASHPDHEVLLPDTLTAVVIDDLNAAVKVAGILQSGGKQYSLRGEGATTLDDLRHGPAVLIGAFDNAWTLRLTSPLRYHFANDPDMSHLWIVDGASGHPRWIVDRNQQMTTNIYRDYAILARFTDSNTGRVAIVVAGIGRGGTRIGGEFLTDNADLGQLMRLAHAAGDKKNIEVVLSTQIIDGAAGSPKIEATNFW